MFKKTQRKSETSEPAIAPSHLRRLAIRALTDAGWLSGTIHVPTAVRLVDFMDRAVNFVSVSDVTMEAHSKSVPFFALHHQAIVLLSADGEEHVFSADGMGIMEDHSISCLLPGGVLKGKVAVKPGMRLSDYLAKHDRFVPVRDCTYQVRIQQPGTIANETADFVLVNAKKVVGMSERADPLFNVQND